MTFCRNIVSVSLPLGLFLIGVSFAEAQRWSIKTRTAGGLVGLCARYPVAKELGIANNADDSFAALHRDGSASLPLPGGDEGHHAVLRAREGAHAPVCVGHV